MILQMEQDRAPLPRLLVPPARREGGRRPHRRRPRRRRHRRPLRRGDRAEPARLLGRGLGVRAQHVVRVHGHAADRRRKPRRTAAGLRGRAARQHELRGLDSDARSTASTRASSTAGRRSSRRCRRPSTNRTHCIVWSDYDTQPQVELAHGIRFDTNYYYWPGSWIAGPARPVHRLRVPAALRDRGRRHSIDVYQAATQMTDESEQSYPATINTLLDNATRAARLLRRVHGEHPHRHRDARAMVGDRRVGAGRVASRSCRPARCSTGSTAATRRRSATCRSPATCSASPSPRRVGANGLQAMLPAKSGSGATRHRDHAQRLAGAVHDRDAQGHRLRRVRRREWHVRRDVHLRHDAARHQRAHRVAARAARHDRVDDRRAGRLKVMYGTSPASLTTRAHRQRARDRALADDHRAHAGRDVLLQGQLRRRGRQRWRRRRPRAARSSCPRSSDGHDARPTSTRHARPCRVVTHSGDGEVTLTPTDGSDFNGPSLPAGWAASPWSGGGSATVGGGQLDRRRRRSRHQHAVSRPGRSLEFVATFQAAPFQHVGFADDLNAAPGRSSAPAATARRLKARTNDGRPRTDDVIPGNWLGTPHRFRIDWTASQVVYSIDGTVVATHTAPLTASMRPAASDPRRRPAPSRRLARHVAVHVTVHVPVAHLRRGETRRLDDARPRRDDAGRDRVHDRDAHLGERHAWTPFVALSGRRSRARTTAICSTAPR